MQIEEPASPGRNKINSGKQPLPEITVKAVFLGVALSLILGAANAYLGLFAGMTVSASIPAAVVSMGLLRMFRRSNILENNIVQTAASAGESLAAGVIFTLPALIILDFWQQFNYLSVTLIAGLGGLLGVLFTIPLRRSLIIEDKLKFPEGIATAEVLKSGERGGSDIKYLVLSGLAGGLFKIGEAGLRLWTSVIETARGIGGTIAYFGSNLSPALLSVGYIVGLNIAVLIFLGGLANWLIAIPICSAGQSWPMPDGKAISAVDWAHQIWRAQTRYLGVGAMLVGGVWTVLKLRGSIFKGIKSGLLAYQDAKGQRQEPARTEKDLPMKWILILIAASAVPLFILYQVFVGQVSVSAPMAVMMLIMGFLFSAVAGYMAGLVGSSNNPISGVTIATVLVSALLLLLLMGTGAANGPAAAIIIGSVVCCAAAIAGDNMQDLKTGYIVGATPWKQQVMQIVGTLSAALVIAPVLILLQRAYGFAGHSSATPHALIAPQANLIASVAKGVFAGGLPWDFVFIGMVAAAGVIMLDEYLVRRGSSFRTPVLAVAIGIYLPLELEMPILAGGIIHQAVKIYHQKNSLNQQVSQGYHHRGLLFASGLITGEALVGILLALPIVLTGRQDVLAVVNEPLGAGPGAILLTGIGYWLYRSGRGKIKA